MSDHPALEQILDRVLGRGDCTGGIAEHLIACASCRQASAWAAALVSATGGGPPVVAPETLIERALSIPSEEPRRRAERERWSIARLVEDAFARPLLAGVRGSATARRMLYELPDGHVDLEIGPEPEDGERFRITAQVLLTGADPSGEVLAILWRDDALAARASGDETGTFVIGQVEPGEYRLEILSPSTGRAIRIASLAVETGVT